MATVGNLESYHFRHDYSTGARVFMGGADCPADVISTSAGDVAVAGPNGPGSAMHAGECYGALKINGTEVGDAYLDVTAWTLAMSFRPGNVEKGILFAIGRLNGGNNSGRLAITICSSSDPSKLYIQEFYRASSGTVPALGSSVTLTGIGNVTNGFHTLVLAYDPAAKTITPYVDGTKKTVLTLSTKTETARKIGNAFQYGSHSSITGIPSGYSRSYTNTDVAFYDLRFYLGTFDDNDATAYAAHFPCTYPFRPNAYVESGATNTTANAAVGNYIDTGYLAKGAASRFVADYLFFDTRAQQRIFGARGNFVQGLYINSSGKLAWNFMGTAKWVDTGTGAGRLRRIATFDRVGKTIAVTNYANRTQFYYNDDQSDFLKATSDANQNTYLFAENNSGAKNFGKARIYSLEIDESGTPVHFFAPALQDGEAGFKDVVTGTFHGDGNKDNSPERTLRFYNGVGCASDYKYEDSTLYAKLYASVADSTLGTVSVDSGAAAASAEGWIPHGGTLALTATAADSTKFEFKEWTGDTWAIANGFSATDASIEVSTPYAVQLRATFKPTVNALLAVPADGAAVVNWSAADWHSAEDTSVAIPAPIDKEVTVVAHRSVTIALDAGVSLSKFVVQADNNCVVTFASNAGGSFYASEVVVSNGVLRQGTAAVFGTTPKVTVEDGGTFDTNGLAPDRGTAFVIAGDGAGDWPWALTSSVNVTDDHISIDIVSLADDATIGGNVQMCIGVRSGATFDPATETRPLTLNGHTLTKTGTGALWFRRPYSTNEGTIDVQGGSMRVSGWNNANAAYAESCVSNIALVVREGTTAQNQLGYTLYFKTLDMRGAALTSASGAFGAGAGETFAGYGTAAKLVMADGAVATLDGNLSVTTALTAEGALSLVRKTGVETNVTVAVTGTLTASGTITVGAGVVFDIGTIRPTATLAVDAAGALALRLVTNDETPVINVAANPANVIVYKSDGVTDITAGCTVEYDADAGTITITPPVPVWTDADGTGSFESVANWDTGTVPADGSSICVSNETDVAVTVSSAHAYDYVTVKGGGSLSFTGSGSLAAGAMAFFDGTELKTGGVVVPAAFNGTGDIVIESGDGAALSITGASTLTGKLTIKAMASFTNTLTAAVSVTNMTVDAGENVVVAFANGTGGSFRADAIVVEGGVLQQGSATAFGSTPKITVRNGGTFDANGFAPSRSTTFLIAGAGAGNWPWALTSSAALTQDSTVDILELADDATIGGDSAIWLGVRNGATFDPAKQTLPLTLNGFTLTKTGTGTLQIRRPYSTNEGTIDVQAGSVRVSGWTNANAEYGATSISNIALVVRGGASAVNAISYALYFSNIDLLGGTLTSSSGAFGVYDTLSGHGAAGKLAMAEGAVYHPDGAGFLAISTTVPSPLNVDLGGIERTSIPLISVPASLENAADAALASVPKGWRIKKNVTGENGTTFVTYTLFRRGFVIVVK